MFNLSCNPVVMYANFKKNIGPPDNSTLVSTYPNPFDVVSSSVREVAAEGSTYILLEI